MGQNAVQVLDIRRRACPVYLREAILLLSICRPALQYMKMMEGMISIW